MPQDEVSVVSVPRPGRPASAPASNAGERWRGLLLIALLAIAPLLAYGPVVGCGFINYDDPAYVTENPHVRAGLSWRSVSWACTTMQSGNWHPLAWLTLLLDSQLWGSNPQGFHLTNLLLHVGSTLLLYAALRRASGSPWPSALTAALFAVHPMNVEAVAWVSERKGVLSTFFWMLTLWAYVRYAAAPNLARYVLVLLGLVLGLLAKPMLVTIPFVLLLLDRWPLRRLERGQPEPANVTSTSVGARAQAPRFATASLRWLLLEKLPLLGVIAIFSFVAMRAQGKAGALPTLAQFSLQGRLKNVAVSYVWYLRHAIVPDGLALHYPHLGDGTPLREALGAGALMLIATVAVLFLGRRKPYLAVGWLWYVGTLVPVIGLVQIGNHARADRYGYIPLIGLFLMTAFGLSELARRRRAQPALAILTATALLALILASRTQARYWHDSVTLWNRTLAVTTANAKAENNLADALLRQGKRGEAIAHYRQALRISPDYPLAHANLGYVLEQQGKRQEAVSHFRAAIKSDPNDTTARLMLATALEKEGRLSEAIALYQQVVKLVPNAATVRNSLGNALTRARRPEEALKQYQEAIRLDPRSADARNNLGSALAALGRFAEAEPHFARAVRLDLDFSLARNNLGMALVEQGKLEQAQAEFLEALRRDPEAPPLHDNLGRLRTKQGRLDEAVREYREALRLDPGYVSARLHLSEALAAQGKQGDAESELNEVLRLRPDDARARRQLEALRQRRTPGSPTP